MSVSSDDRSTLWNSSTCPRVLPRCDACEEPIQDPKDATFALGTVFHKEHFNCIECLAPVRANNYRRVDGEIYCEEDYHRLFSLRCSHCNEPIRHNGVVIMGQPYHRDACFRCAACNKVLKEDNFYPVNGKPYCKTHWKKYFAPKCLGCKRPISRAMAGGSIVDGEYKEVQYHPECYFLWNP